MTEQLISLETAKLAKEKRFNIYSPAYYSCDNPSSGMKGNKLCIKTWCKHIDIGKKDSQIGTAIYSAPTQSFLQKYLREKYNIFITVKCDCHGKFDYHGYDVNCKEPCFVKPEFQVDESGCFEIGHFPYRFNTYEEALDIGLQEALKLIK